MYFFDNEKNQKELNPGDFVAIFKKPNEFVAAIFQSKDKKILTISDGNNNISYLEFEKTVSIEECKIFIESKIGFILQQLEGEEKTHKENNLGQFAYSFIPAKNREKNIEIAVFIIKDPA